MARRGFVTPQSVLVNLERAGLVERRAHPEHGRVLQAYLTGEGKELVSRAHGTVGEVEEIMLVRLRMEDRTRLAEMLRGCTESLEAG